MTTADGRFTMVYNGEIYNFVEVRAELEKLGDVFCVAIRHGGRPRGGVRALGPGRLGRLRGMFAIAVVGRSRGSLFLARDRLGVKLLHYRRAGLGGPHVRVRGPLRSSPLRASPEPAARRRRAIGATAFGAVSEPDTIPAGVHALAPGHWSCSRGRQELTCAVFRTLPIVEDRDASFAEEVEGIRPILQEAVGLRLIADVPVGVFLSGGIDSSVLVALATRRSADLRRCTRSPSPSARSASARRPSPPRWRAATAAITTEVHFPASQALSDFGDAVRARPIAPSADGVNTLLRLEGRAPRPASPRRSPGSAATRCSPGTAAGRGVRPAARGLARAFGRLPPPACSAASAPRRRRPSRPIQLLQALGGCSPAAARRRRRTAGSGPCSRAEERRDAPRARPRPAGLHLGVDVPAGLARLYAEGRVGPVNAFSALEISNYLRHTLLRDTDAMSMAHPIEVRVPFLDHVLVERLMRVPGALKLAAGPRPREQAAAHRRGDGAARGRRQPAQDGLHAPVRHLVPRPAAAVMMEEISSSATPCAAAGRLDDEGRRALWRAFLRGDRYTTHARVWCVAAFAAWWRRQRRRDA